MILNNEFMELKNIFHYLFLILFKALKNLWGDIFGGNNQLTNLSIVKKIKNILIFNIIIFY